MNKYISIILFAAFILFLRINSSASICDTIALQQLTVSKRLDSCGYSKKIAANNDKANTFTIDTAYLRVLGKDSTLTDSVSSPNKIQKRKKIVAVIFAFPFPFGFVGVHRVMLGTKPWVPIVYVATFGGCFGLLPLIDFCTIAFSKNIEQYENNDNIFMWLKQ